MENLKQIVETYTDEYGWVDDGRFCVWVDWMFVDDFFGRLRESYGVAMFDYGGITAHFKDGYICVEMSDTGIDIEKYYPKDEYSR